LSKDKHHSTSAVVDLQDARARLNSTGATLLISPPHARSWVQVYRSIHFCGVAELGLDLCALRERNRSSQASTQGSDLASANLMPGFIHSSPAMTRLVEEVHKIRSSNVTVLVTGESGTGQELVARAIHALSSRREKIFVPFKCTAVTRRGLYLELDRLEMTASA
jgi:transcriptional regulator with PAS, ATPase and Fis domain